MLMDGQLKQRVVGAAVLVGLGVIFIPIFLDDGALPPPVPDAVSIPPEPTDDFASRVVPMDSADVEALRAKAEQVLEPAVGEVTAPTDAGDHVAAGDDDLGAPPAAPGSPDEPEPDATADEGDPRTGVVAWTVQLGSFANDENARRLIEKLREADFPAYLERRLEKERTVFKVRVGPEIRREDAEALRDRLQEKFALKGMLLRYQ